jgi:hypothetical protein
VITSDHLRALLECRNLRNLDFSQTLQVSSSAVKGFALFVGHRSSVFSAVILVTIINKLVFRIEIYMGLVFSDHDLITIIDQDPNCNLQEIAMLLKRRYYDFSQTFKQFLALTI